jgi:hypothetical protein
MMPVQHPSRFAKRPTARGEGYHGTAIERRGRRPEPSGQACCRRRFPPAFPSARDDDHGPAPRPSGSLPPLSRRSWRKKRPPRSSAAETVGYDKRRPDELLDQVRQRQTEAHRDDKRQPERTGEEDQSDGPVHRECAANVSSLTPRR